MGRTTKSHDKGHRYKKHKLGINAVCRKRKCDWLFFLDQAATSGLSKCGWCGGRVIFCEYKLGSQGLLFWMGGKKGNNCETSGYPGEHALQPMKNQKRLA